MAYTNNNITMVCEYCGGRFNDNVRRCPNCGAPLTEHRHKEAEPDYNVNVTGDQNNSYAPEEQPAKGKSNDFWILIVLFAFPPVGLVFLWKSKWNLAAKIVLTVAAVAVWTGGINGASS